jgi:hypothetical protein
VDDERTERLGSRVDGIDGLPDDLDELLGEALLEQGVWRRRPYLVLWTPFCNFERLHVFFRGADIQWIRTQNRGHSGYRSVGLERVFPCSRSFVLVHSQLRSEAVARLPFRRPQRIRGGAWSWRTW